MSDKQMREEMFDAMIAAAGRMALDDEVNGYSADEGADHVFSARFEKKMKSVLRRRHPGLGRRVAGILIASVLLSLAFFVTAFASNSEFRAQVLKLIYTWTGESMDFSFSDSGGTDGGTYLPKYLPDGYEEVRVLDYDQAMDIWYENAAGDRIIITRNTRDEGSFLSVDTEHGDYELVEIGRYVGHMFRANEQGMPSHVIYSTETFLFSINGVVEADELVKIAVSMVE